MEKEVSIKSAHIRSHLRSHLKGVMRKMSLSFKVLFFLFLFYLPHKGFPELPSYEEAKKTIQNMPEEIKRVVESGGQNYNFASKFDREKSSVNYTDQIFRHLLINGLKKFMGSLERGAFHGESETALYALNSYFNFRYWGPRYPEQGIINGQDHYIFSFKDLNGQEMDPYEGYSYNNIQAHGFRFEFNTLLRKNTIQFEQIDLSRKIAGNDNILRQGELKGWDTSKALQGVDLQEVDADFKGDDFVEPEDFIQAIFRVLSKNAVHGSYFLVNNGNESRQRVSKATVTKDGVDLKELVNKFLQGAISLSQASGDFLSTNRPDKGLNADNRKPRGTGNSTALESNWDKAFGYFGAARDAGSYTDLEIKSKGSKDTNEDGKISVLTETNMPGAAVNSGRMDVIVKEKGDRNLDLSGEVFHSFVSGRKLIAQAPDGHLEYVKAYAAIALFNWEKTLAATVVHYINETLKIMGVYGTPEYKFIYHAKFWSEMKGYAMAFQFSPSSPVSNEDFIKFHNLVGDKPVLMTSELANINEYKKKLLEARDILRDSFGFSEANARAL